MHSLILCLALVTQSKDWGFERAVESFVIQTVPQPVIASEHAPREIGRWIDQLGASCWKCRDIASRKLKAIGDPAVPWLFWGLKSSDAQIRMSSWLLLRDLAGCRFCRGTGLCIYFMPDSTEKSCVGCGWGEYAHTNPEHKRTCSRCEGRPGSLDMHALSF